MSTVGVSKRTLNVLNAIILILGLGLVVTALWFYIEVQMFANLRNYNHYLLDYRIYWPQAIPWLFIIVGVCVLSSVCCGFSGANRKNRRLLHAYCICMGITVFSFVTVAVIALVFADSKLTDDFMKDTVWDVYFQSKSNPDVANAFGNIERRLHCCGADSPRDYKNWKEDFPQSCCDLFYRGMFLEPYTYECGFSNQLANERHGCTEVATEYSRIIIKVLAAVCILIAFLCCIAIAVAAGLSKAVDRKARSLASLAARHETESEKVLI